MVEEVPEVPLEVKREMGISSLWSLWIATLAMIGDSFAGFSYGVPWEKFMAGLKTLCQALAGQGAKILLESFKIPGNDCTTVAKVHHISSDAFGFETEIIEMTPEKAVVHAKRCLPSEMCPSMFPRFLDAPVEEIACTFFDEATGKAVNPKITHRFGETFCKGGKICENIWELKE
jgi:hypothetical protein